MLTLMSTFVFLSTFFLCKSHSHWSRLLSNLYFAPIQEAIDTILFQCHLLTWIWLVFTGQSGQSNWNKVLTLPQQHVLANNFLIGHNCTVKKGFQEIVESTVEHWLWVRGVGRCSLCAQYVQFDQGYIWIWWKELLGFIIRRLVVSVHV